MTGRARSKKMSVPPRRGPKKREGAPSAGSRVLQWTLAALGLLAFVTAVLLLFAFPAARGPGTGRDVELDVPGGESTDVLVARLVAAGLTDSPRLFGLYLRLTGGAGRVVPGVHLLTDDLPAKDVMARLERSMSSGRVRVTIPEGWTVFDISRRLQTMHVCTIKSWLDAVRAPTILAELHIPGESAEGYLFPATYDLAPDSDAGDVVRRMKAEFDKRYAAIEGRHAPGVLDLESSLGWATRRLGYTRQDFLTLQMFAVLFFAALIPVSALLADRIGGRKVLLIASLLLCVFGFAIAPLFGGGRAGVIAYLVIGFTLTGFTYGPLGSALSSLFPAAVRYTGTSLAFNLAGILGGSFAAPLATWLATDYDLRYVGYYLSAASLLSLLALLVYRPVPEACAGTPKG